MGSIGLSNIYANLMIIKQIFGIFILFVRRCLISISAMTLFQPIE